MARNLIRREISIENFKALGKKEEQWLETDEAQRLFTELEVLKWKQTKFQTQIKRFETSGDLDATSLTHRRSYLELFLSSSRGLAVVSGAGARNSDD